MVLQKPQASAHFLPKGPNQLWLRDENCGADAVKGPRGILTSVTKILECLYCVLFDIKEYARVELYRSMII